MPKSNTELPKRLLIQIGRVATITADIEQDFILWASALYSQSTGGKPVEHLRMGFQRLLNKWHMEARKRLDHKTLTRVISPMRADLARWWPVRNYIIHGKWMSAGRQRYKVILWEQDKKLQLYQHTFALREIREIANIFGRLLKQLRRYTYRASWPSSPRKRGGRQQAGRRRSYTKRA